MDFGLNERVIKAIHQVLDEHPGVDKALLYGSRAMGRHKPGSDIDLSLVGQDVSPTERDKILLALDDLDLPYTFDVSIFDQLPREALREHIERVGVVFYERGVERSKDAVETG